MLKATLAFLLFASFPASIPALGSVSAQDQQADFTAAGCGPNDAQFDVKTNKKDHSLPQPGPGKAAIVVLTSISCIGSCPTMRVGVDGEWVGAEKGKSYLFSFVDPGNHNVCVAQQSSLKRRSKPAGAISVPAEAGGVYYMFLSVGKRGEWIFQPLDSAEGPLQVASSGHSTVTLGLGKTRFTRGKK